MPRIRQHQHRQEHHLRRHERPAQERARDRADAAYRRRNFTPEATAKAIVKAIKTGPAVVPIAAESRIGYAMRRISPGAIRLLARWDIRQT